MGAYEQFDPRKSWNAQPFEFWSALADEDQWTGENCGPEGFVSKVRAAIREDRAKENARGFINHRGRDSVPVIPPEEFGGDE